MIILVAVVIGGIYYITSGFFRGDNGIPDGNPPDGPATEPPAEDPIKVRLAGLTLDEKIGQMVIVGFTGYEIDDQVREMIEQYRVGGFILFGTNIRDAEQLLELLNSLKAANADSKLPLFLSVDEEGGRVSRMPAELTKLPTNKVIGNVNNPDFSFAVGSVIATELRAFGFNLDFAPVLDVNSNPRNPVIGDRSFGAEAETVSRLGLRTMQGLQSGGIISVVKHFPGHGDTAVDSHVGLPVVNHDLARLQALELIPFAAAVDNHADAVMVAHILLPQLDPVNPASLSPAIITDILREDMKFNGVVVTDDLTMGAITENYSIGEAAVKAVQAGADIVLVCHSYSEEAAAVEALRRAAADGTVPPERIDASVYRILQLKEKYRLNDAPTAAVDIKAINAAIGEVLGQYTGE